MAKHIKSKHWGKCLKIAIARRGLPFCDVGKAAGLKNPHQAMNSLFKTARVTLDTVGAIAAALGVKTATLVRELEEIERELDDALESKAGTT